MAIIRADARHIPLRDKSVQCVVTSPPYYGLRDYGTGTWQGGDAECDHKQHVQPRTERDRNGLTGGLEYMAAQEPIYRNACPCGARRIDRQIGLEPTPDEYVATMVGVFREVWRVLRDDGTVWLNLGDSYAAGGSGGYSDKSTLSGFTNPQTKGRVMNATPIQRSAPNGLKPKDLCGMPWRIAFALQADGWYLRSDIIWAKPNPMPESVTDRPTRSHEYLFLLSKKPTYYYDAAAIAEPLADSSIARLSQPTFNSQNGGPKDYGEGSNRSARGALENLQRRYGPSGHHKTRALIEQGNRTTGGLHDGREYYGNGASRNKRDVWTVNSEPTPEAHFATFPQKLVEPCILAGTSEKGCCAECGAPRVRETDVGYEVAGRGNNNMARKGAAFEGTGSNRAYETRMLKHVTTTGWRPSCSHDAPSVPCVVFDPFLGSGTVGKVCERLGRRWVGLELSEPYIEIARKRTAQQGFMFGGAAEVE